MLTQVTLISIILTSVAIQAKQLDRGPQTFTDTNDSSAGAAQNQQKRFASKGIIVYLTADQIKEFQAGKMELQSLSSGETSISRRPNVRKLQQQNSQSRFNSHRENLNILKAPLVHKSQLVDIEQEQQGEGYVNAPNRLPLNRGGLTPQLLLFSPDNQKPEIQSNKKTQQSNKNELSPRNPVNQENSEEQYLQEQIKKYFQNTFENNNYKQGKPVSNVQRNQPESSNQEAQQQQQEVANYNSLLNALVRGNLLREQNNATENQQSSEQENALGNLSPVIIQKEVHITQHKHVPVVKHVKVPVPTPVLVPILHPYEVRVPQPYPVPAEANARVPTQERNAERNVQENTERNVQRNSDRNAERNAEKDAVRSAERNAERNAEENAERNGESTAESTAERNAEGAEVQRVPFELRHHGKNVYINVDSPAYLQLWKHK
ncbi:transcriptional regulator DEF1-like [Colias croceus]|uniref:transcriptional regulator DEF1-like n=1 Tax=Colias crocea TaxID=72248 RepID=UPI001E27F85C|nr:transcriptional regulator DEF1-like [Colias croceus]